MCGPTSASRPRRRRRGGHLGRITRRRTHRWTCRRRLPRHRGRSKCSQDGTKAASIGFGPESRGAIRLLQQADSHPANAPQHLCDHSATWSTISSCVPCRNASLIKDSGTSDGSACAAKPTFTTDPVSRLATLAVRPIFQPGPAGAGCRHCHLRVAGTAGSTRSQRSR